MPSSGRPLIWTFKMARGEMDGAEAILQEVQVDGDVNCGCEGGVASDIREHLGSPPKNVRSGGVTGKPANKLEFSSALILGLISS